MSKTIIFCVDIDHAQRMRQELINLNADIYSKNGKYIMQITGDNEEGKLELDSFQNPEHPYPTLVTTSKLLTTGVDVPTCKVIVLDANINSMTEFKQTIGRGTRLSKDYGKYYFTIIDFRDNARNFADENFDGPPIQDRYFEQDQELDPGEPDNTEDLSDEDRENISEDDFEEMNTNSENSESEDDETPHTPRPKIYVNGVKVSILNERVQYYGKDGKLTNQSIKDFSKENILEKYKTLDDFIRNWNDSEKKKVIIDELKEQGIFFDALQKEIGKELDPFDLICHIAFDMPALSRKERADKVTKRNYFGKYNEKVKIVLENLLEKYAISGIENIETTEVLKLDPLKKLGSPIEIIKIFGNKANYLKEINRLKQEIYKIA